MICEAILLSDRRFADLPSSLNGQRLRADDIQRAAFVVSDQYRGQFHNSLKHRNQRRTLYHSRVAIGDDLFNVCVGYRSLMFDNGFRTR